MPGSTTAPGRTGARNGAPVRIAFRQRYSVSAQNDVDFAAQWLAYAIPCRRFADILADACARLGADVVCYSFIAVDSHHLLLAGLPAHAACDPTESCCSGFLGLKSPLAGRQWTARGSARQLPPIIGRCHIRETMPLVMI